MNCVFVGAVPEPDLSIISVEGDEVTLQCEVVACLPEPEIMFLNDKGDNISAENPRRYSSGECFNMTKRVTLPATTKRFNFNFFLVFHFKRSLTLVTWLKFDFSPIYCICQLA